jgi:uncharacterized linocin/CFP29 family protein
MTDDYLQHHETPLTPEEFGRLHEGVVSAARRRLVGRRFIELYGPMGPGVQAIPYDEFTNVESGQLDLTGEAESQPVFTDSRRFRPLLILYKDFVIHWRDLEMQRQLNMPIDDSAAAGAASWCAEKEDELIFYGDEKYGFEGLMTHPQRNRVALSGGWDRPGAAFRDVVAATEKLFESGHYGPYAMVVSPRLYANLHRMWEDARTLEIDNVRRLLDGGLFRSDVLQNNSAVVVSTGRENMDIALGLDMTVAYLGAERMNHPFRVLETLALRIKHPDSICTIEEQPGDTHKGEKKKDKS